MGFVLTRMACYKLAWHLFEPLFHPPLSYPLPATVESSIIRPSPEPRRPQCHALEFQALLRCKRWSLLLQASETFPWRLEAAGPSASCEREVSCSETSTTGGTSVSQAHSQLPGLWTALLGSRTLTASCRMRQPKSRSFSLGGLHSGRQTSVLRRHSGHWTSWPKPAHCADGGPEKYSHVAKMTSCICSFSLLGNMTLLNIPRCLHKNAAIGLLLFPKKLLQQHPRS